MIKNILEDIVYIAPIEGLPIPEGMCVNCSIEASNNITSTETQENDNVSEEELNI